MRERVCVCEKEREREKRDKRDFIKNARLYFEYNHCNFFAIIFFSKEINKEKRKRKRESQKERERKIEAGRRNSKSGVRRKEKQEKDIN